MSKRIKKLKNGEGTLLLSIGGEADPKFVGVIEKWGKIFAEVRKSYPGKQFQFVPYTYIQMDYNTGQALKSMLAIPI